ncbi:hypothetical protein K1719_036925 [Acacia pycnantha]|nr:hypothetical protein K1719_036925 [Acacia pycnantha]
MGNRFLRAICKEWQILQENLPESIFIRVSETRYDLLRAAIIGAAGTPYHDALFFFDIALTPNYPNEPPKTERALEPGNVDIIPGSAIDSKSRPQRKPLPQRAFNL